MIGITIIIKSITMFFTFGFIISKHRHYCTFHSKYTDRQIHVAFLLV